MSVLFWIFGLGALATAFPFLFHLIRRTPKGQTEFSSLMFLKPTPPTLTRRSRLENLLLLALRMGALVLIAFAFMRPFYRSAEYLGLESVAGRRVAILVDVSASMQRADLWGQAKNQVDSIVGELEDGDEVGLYAFSDELKPLVDFGTSPTQQEIAVEDIRSAMSNTRPGYAIGDLGQALVSVADQLASSNDDAGSDTSSKQAKLQIVVISDLQKGMNLDRLQSFQWPENVFADFRLVATDSGNATVQVLNPIQDDDQVSARRVRVKSYEGSVEEQFFVSWDDAQESRQANDLPFFVSPGTSRVLQLDDGQATFASEFEVTGDDEPYDNTYFVIPPKKRTVVVGYLGSDDSQDPEGLLFYLERALTDTVTTEFQVRQWNPEFDSVSEGEPAIEDASDLLSSVDLLVVGGATGQRTDQAIDRFLNTGGTVLFVLRDPGLVEFSQKWTLAEIETATADASEKSDYALLASIDFQHPLFATFDSAKFNDFTGIRFWRHQRIKFADSESQAKILAGFDDEFPALWERRVGDEGRVYALTTGWAPTDSQLALSTKFVPLVNNLVSLAMKEIEIKENLRVGDSLEFPAVGNNASLLVPNQGNVSLVDGQTQFQDTESPGIYVLEDGDTTLQFSVNMDRSESETQVLAVEQLEMLDVNVGTATAASLEKARKKSLQDLALENEQKLWKWLITGAIVILLIETWLAGRTAFKNSSVTGTDVGRLDMSGENV